MTRLYLFMVLLFIVALAVLSYVQGYTPPTNNAVALVLNDSYTAPTNNAVALTLGNGTATPGVTCTISSSTTITSNLDCSGETFLIIDNSDVVVNSGVEVTCLIEAIESGSSLASKGAIIRGVS